MGIRFYCPNGHRLNVKEFLAGKRGICPRCEVRFRIPLESEIPAGSPRIRPGSVAAQGEAGAPNGKRRAKAAMVAANSASETATSMAAPISRDGPAAHDRAERDMFELCDDSPLAHEVLIVPEVAAAGDGSVVEDVISESPDAIWYVRPPTGGQYGPAKGDAVRRWIAEGRVAADALVWREGWAEWQAAGPVFRGLLSAYNGSDRRAADASPTRAQASDSPPAIVSPRGTSPRAAARKKPVAAVVVLALLVVALCVGLAMVLTMKS
jgi:hypothetical protein